MHSSIGYLLELPRNKEASITFFDCVINVFQQDCLE